MAVTTGDATESGERRERIAWRRTARAAAPCAAASVLLGALAGAACAPADAPEATPTEDATGAEEVGPLLADPACAQASSAVARAHLAAAGSVRGTLSMMEGGPRWEIALNRLASAQRACLEVAGAAGSSAPAWSLRAALLTDVAVARADRGGVPSLAWRLTEDGAVRASLSLPAVDAALDEGRLAAAYEGLLDAQRARLLGLPEVLRFLDEAGRAALLSDPAWIRWLGVSS